MDDGSRIPARNLGLACLIALAVSWFGSPVAAGPCFWQATYGAEVTLLCDREPCTLTVSPDGQGETLEEAGITLRMRLYCDFGYDLGPAASVPAEEIILWSSRLCTCVGKAAARATDENGYTEFTGTFFAGGCTDRLDLFVDGTFSTTIPLRLNSPDSKLASPCYIDGSDFGALAIRLGNPAQYSFCADYDESGSIDGSDLAFFASLLGSACP